VGIPVSLLVLAVGAILAFAVTGHSDAVNIQAVGWILMAVGLLGLLLSLIMWDTWAGGGFWRGGGARARRPYDEAPTRVGRAPRRPPPR
jgi:uncharacterized protein DUF6458